MNVVSTYSMKNSDTENAQAAATAMRGQWGFGDATDKEQLDDLLAGRAKLAAGGRGGRGGNNG
ncbi:MAG: hypothetical protein Ta2A_11210 [Treponemataceae bacterium]|nr:MAG: hypothetical protein Ta2A_11210 [Treponemataceae bacterium]